MRPLSYDAAMFRPMVLVAAGMSAMSLGLAPQTPPSDATAALLATVRQALGGEAALTDVKSFDVKGTLTRTSGSGTRDEAIEFAADLPYRFVQVTESTSDLGPLGTARHRRREGFAYDRPIAESVDDSPVPPPTVAAKAPTTPQEIADRDARQLISARRAFSVFVLPLFAQSPASCPMTFAAGGHVVGPSGPADIIDATGPDGFVHHLFVDATTHLIVGIAWMAKPVLSMTVASSAAMTSRGLATAGAPLVLPAHPTANLPDVQWQLTIGDYRSANGLHWPHRLTTTFGGRKWEDVKLGAYRINGKVDESMFRIEK